MEAKDMCAAIGDVVTLNSGGLPMTVVNVTDLGSVECVWFDRKEMDTGVFPQAALCVVKRAS